MVRIYLDVADAVVERLQAAGFRVGVVVLGDFNVERANSGEEEVDPLFILMNEKGYVYALNHGGPPETTFGSASKLALDYIFTKKRRRRGRRGRQALPRAERGRV